jgi:hypothetical protein
LSQISITSHTNALFFRPLSAAAWSMAFDNLSVAFNEIVTDLVSTFGKTGFLDIFVYRDIDKMFTFGYLYYALESVKGATRRTYPYAKENHQRGLYRKVHTGRTRSHTTAFDDRPRLGPAGSSGASRARNRDRKARAATGLDASWRLFRFDQTRQDRRRNPRRFIRRQTDGLSCFAPAVHAGATQWRTQWIIAIKASSAKPFPKFGEAELLDLASDIAANGQHNPIVLYQG